MNHIRWDSLRNLAGLTLDQLEAKQHHDTDRQAGLRARGIIK